MASNDTKITNPAELFQDLRTYRAAVELWRLQAHEMVGRLAERHGDDLGALCVDLATCLRDAAACTPTMPVRDVWTVGAIASALDVAGTELEAPAPHSRRRLSGLGAMVSATSTDGFVGFAREVALMLILDGQFNRELVAELAAAGGDDRGPHGAFLERLIDLVITEERPAPRPMSEG